jgi:16S rRNA G966 N2-methylase RsmD
VKPYYQDAAVTLYHGDCLEVLSQLEPVDHVITDPPYDRDVYMRAKKTLDRRNSGPGLRGMERARGATLEKFAVGSIGLMDDAFAGALAAEWSRLLRRWVLVFSDAESTERWRRSLVAGGMRYVRTGAWAKPNAMPQMCGDRPAQGFEPCTIGHSASQRTRWNGGGSAALWIHNTAVGDARPEGHPCPKPLPLMVELVTDFTDEGETILDPFAGSGTTGVAAKLNGRKAILIEREEKYCEIAAKRLEQTQPGRLFDSLKAKPQSFLAAMGEPGEGLRGKL